MCVNGACNAALPAVRDSLSKPDPQGRYASSKHLVPHQGTSCMAGVGALRARAVALVLTIALRWCCFAVQSYRHVCWARRTYQKCQTHAVSCLFCACIVALLGAHELRMDGMGRGRWSCNVSACQYSLAKGFHAPFSCALARLNSVGWMSSQKAHGPVAWP
jgi:hypothetical protein